MVTTNHQQEHERMNRNDNNNNNKMKIIIMEKTHIHSPLDFFFLEPFFFFAAAMTTCQVVQYYLSYLPLLIMIILCEKELKREKSYTSIDQQENKYVFWRPNMQVSVIMNALLSLCFPFLSLSDTVSNWSKSS